MMILCWFWIIIFCLRFLLDEDEIFGQCVRDVQVNDPVHEIEADEADGEYDARILVDIGRREAVEFVQILARWQHDGRGLLVHAWAVCDVVQRTVGRQRGAVNAIVAGWLVQCNGLSVRLHQETDLLIEKDRKQRN